jgi:hypothetical protein
VECAAKGGAHGDVDVAQLRMTDSGVIMGVGSQHTASLADVCCAHGAAGQRAAGEGACWSTCGIACMGHQPHLTNLRHQSLMYAAACLNTIHVLSGDYWLAVRVQ